MSKPRKRAKPKESLSSDQTEELCSRADEILRTLDVVATAALDAIGTRAVADPRAVLVGIENPMTTSPAASRRISTIGSTQRGHLQRVASEPFVCRIAVEAGDGARDTLYITRGSATAVNVPGIKLATYTSPLGRIAELDIGDFHSYVVKGLRHEYRVAERVDLRPELREQWDAIDVAFALETFRSDVDSLRRFLDGLGRTIGEDDLIAQLEAEEAEHRAALERQRRRVIQRMALRDQPTLDKFQGEIFRMPLDRQVFLHGPPGSGKTTTLILRLAQKRNPEALTEEEAELLEHTGMRESFERADNWVMFSPTNLLQLYLRDAFNREHVPADSTHNLRTWERTRLDLSRNVLGILRVSSDARGYELDETETLRRHDSASLSKLTDELSAFNETAVLTRLERAFNDLKRVPDESVRGAVERLLDRLRPGKNLSFREVSALIEEAAPLQAEVTRLRKDTDAEIDKLRNSLLAANKRAVLEELVAALPTLVGERDTDDDADDGDEEDEEDEPQAPIERNPRLVAAQLLHRALRSRARAVAEKRRPSVRVERIFAILGARAPADAQFAEIGRKLLMVRSLRAIIRAPRDLFSGIPRQYARLRRSQVATLLSDEALTSVRHNRLSPAELDVIILTMLTVARRYFEHDRKRLRGDTPSWLSGVRERYVSQVFVDEATDFSAVQLAATIELTHPTLRSWFASGDFRQRITPHGIRAIEELDWISRATGLRDKIDVREVTIGYRQTRRLELLASALSGKERVSPPDSSQLDAEEPWPLLREHATGLDLARWIAERLAEVERASSQLPSVAVFVDGEHRIDPLVESLRPALRRLSINVRACRDGNDIGDSQEVRVFDVRHIKGLEFEAVFFVGLDSLATSLPELFDRFLFVGTTRAATFLAATCEGSFPAALEPIRAHFSSDRWRA